MNDSFGFAACGFIVHTFNLVDVMISVLFNVIVVFL